MAFISGQYIATYGASPGAVGQTKTGLTTEHQIFAQAITGDNMAKATQDEVFQGADMFIDWTSIEYNAAKMGVILWPFGAAIFDMGVIGTLMSSLAAQIILTAVTGTPAQAGAAPATLTFTKAILAQGFPVKLLFAPENREVPIRQRIYPNSSRIFGTIT